MHNYYFPQRYSYIPRKNTIFTTSFTYINIMRHYHNNELVYTFKPREFITLKKVYVLVFTTEQTASQRDLRNSSFLWKNMINTLLCFLRFIWLILTYYKLLDLFRLISTWFILTYFGIFDLFHLNSIENSININDG